MPRAAPCPGTVRVGSQVPSCIQTTHHPIHLDSYLMSSLHALIPLGAVVSSESGDKGQPDGQLILSSS